MIVRSVLMVLCGMTLMAADADFNGKWNIHVELPRGRAWWLEVSGAGTASPGGWFVGAPGGQVDRIESIKIEGGQLEFVFERKRGEGLLRQVYQARLEGSELRGTMEQTAGGATQTKLAWRGVRAPEITEKDDGSWQPGRPVALFDGTSTEQWRPLVEGRPGWYLEDGLLKNRKGATDLVSKPKFWNFVLRAEYRYEKGSNSGIALRGRYEVQIHDDYGRPTSNHGHGALYSRAAPKQNASRAPGEWQLMEVRMVGRDLTVTLNGVKILDKVRVDGPTAMVMDPEEGKPGPFVLQGDHGPIEFRSIVVTPLQKR